MTQPAPVETTVTAADALVHFRYLVDATHRYIAYFQFFTGATATLIFGKDFTDTAGRCAILIGWLMFGVLNGIQAYRSQADSLKSWRAIRRFDELNSGTGVAIVLRKPASPLSIKVMYIAILFGLGAVMVWAIAQKWNA